VRGVGAPPAIVSNYNLYKVQQGEARGLQAVHARLRGFLQQEGGNVVAMRG
jgi:hypothetical protein